MSGARNGISSSSRFPFTASQWQELEHQALIFKYMISGMPIPPDLIFTIKRGTALRKGFDYERLAESNDELSKWMNRGVHHNQLCLRSGDNMLLNKDEEIEIPLSRSFASKYAKKRVNCVMMVADVAEIHKALRASDVNPLEALNRLFHSPTLRNCSVDFRHRQRDPAVEWRQIMDRQSGSGKAVSRWLTGEEKKRGPTLIIAIANFQYIAVSLVEANPVRHLCIRTLPAFDPSVDDVSDNTVAWGPAGCTVCAGWPPSTSDNIIPPDLRSDPKAQPYRFESTLTVLNNGLEELKSWRVFVGFQHDEYLVSASNVVLADGSSVLGLSSHLSLNQETPFIRFAQLTANQAILESVQNQQAIHILDFDILHSVQWPPLMQAIAKRGFPSLSLRITGTGSDLDILCRTGDRLAKFSHSLGLKFQFHPLLLINTDDYDPTSTVLLLPRETLAVNCVLYIHRLFGDRDRARLFLHMIKSMSPKHTYKFCRFKLYTQTCILRSIISQGDYAYGAQVCLCKRLLLVAVQIIAIANFQYVAVSLVEANPVRHLCIRTLPAFDPSVDDVSDNTVAWGPAGCIVCAGWPPSARDNIVARGPAAITVYLSSIKSLNGFNFRKWKEQISIILGVMDLEYALRVDASAALTVESSTEQKVAYEKWECSNRISIMIMKGSITTAIRGAIPDSDNAKTYLAHIE
ncbi:hypothetical protein RJ640_027834 [Escallonia rubra]|uniref:QLQ domain-containing protein n=1 Tax=Escallonia rubra TaxID=112253 RepID=A0AA88RW69_9ASTE|nr:hypothetical protein RJ640_027834 [Escallonia rubra]